MTKQEFKELTQKRIVLLDGGMGSCLIKEGMPQGVCPEAWMIDNPHVQMSIQSAYANAGADIVYAPTFTANRPKLAEHGLEDRLEEINIGLVENARKAVENADHKVYIAGDMTMTGIMLKPMGPMDFEELIDIYKEQANALIKGGVDLFIVETMMSVQETRACVIAIKESCDLPIMATLTFESDGRTLLGTDAKTAAITLASLGVDAIGTNCSTGPKDMSANVRAMREVVDIPVIAKPNAGIPRLDDNGDTVYDNTPENFANEMQDIIDAGATIIGGCCGTNPDYIKAVSDKRFVKSQINIERKPNTHYLTSERKTVSFTLDDSFMIVGERINPTGKKAFQAQLLEGNIEKALEFATEQEANGASLLDVNLGMSGVDEKELMLRTIDELSTVTQLPLCIDSSHVDIIEAALRKYPGRALINSISNESHKRDALLKIAQKYGAMFILLPLSDKGLPESLDEKIDIINTVSHEALKLGFKKEDIVVDGLVATVGANKNAGIETLETIKYCYENGFATTCGLSNISFGLPQRGYINATFLSMAIANGLTMAISNPNQNLLMSTALAANLLRNKQDSDTIYIEKMNALAEAGIDSSGGNVSLAASYSKQASQTSEVKPEDELRSAVLKGKKNTVEKITNDCIDAGCEPQFLLNDVLIPAINEVGDLFEKGKYFLPQLISSAETMKMSIEILEPLLSSGSNKDEMPVIVIATVEGDIHDIGKNLVALMLKNYGFNVIDLGKDVSKERIIEAAKQYDADIIALSALMTTTMKQMEIVNNLVKENGLKAKVVIGGAVTSEHYADEIKADGYSKDAAAAVKLCQRLLNMVS
jgi:5-methyltetrahydrofolate--homocysteine methyltransferase